MATLGVTIDELYTIIEGRRSADPTNSYTSRLLTGDEDYPLKKVGEEAAEVIMAAKDNDSDHLRYEAVDLLYHLLVACVRWGLSADELEAEIRGRFK
ncbi:MAG: phosphoribosyl-ATP diphosphatase [Actinomycetes bacterium]|jgi:phosphoribosyl-ATP pyrophosphohydrolase|nr:phosphoribosyl-ATP diphosphatase [Actinomycetes bacterium]